MQRSASDFNFELNFINTLTNGVWADEYSAFAAMLSINRPIYLIGHMFMPPTPDCSNYDDFCAAFMANYNNTRFEIDANDFLEPVVIYLDASHFRVCLKKSPACRTVPQPSVHQFANYPPP